MKETKEQKGITLIALVITIIILLILAGIAISQLTNMNIFNRAQVAVDQYNIKAGQAQTVIGQLEDLLEQYTGTGGGSGGESTPTPTPTPTGPLLSIVADVGDYVIYDPTLGVTNSSLLTYTSPAGQLKVKNSSNEYVVNESDDYYSGSTYNGAYNLINENGEYQVPAGYTVESDVAGNGSGNQTYTAYSYNNRWRVLDVNTTTGVIKLIPDPDPDPDEESDSEIIQMAIELRGLRGYKNAETELNNISGIYGHGQGATGARSITMADINYTPPSMENVNPVYFTDSTANIGEKKWKSTDYIADITDTHSDFLEMLCITDNDAYYYNKIWLPSHWTTAQPDYCGSFIIGVSYLDMSVEFGDWIEETEEYTYISYSGEIISKGVGDEMSDDAQYFASFYNGLSESDYFDKYYDVVKDMTEEEYEEFDSKFWSAYESCECQMWGTRVEPVVTLRANVEQLGGSGTKDSPWVFQITN